MSILILSSNIYIYILCLFTEAKGSTTTPICQILDGMNSHITIPSSEIIINDKMAVPDNLRPTSDAPMESSRGTLIIQYTPSINKPVKEVELISTENIKTFTVKFYNVDGSVTIKTVRIVFLNSVIYFIGYILMRFYFDQNIFQKRDRLCCKFLMM